MCQACSLRLMSLSAGSLWPPTPPPLPSLLLAGMSRWRVGGCGVRDGGTQGKGPVEPPARCEPTDNVTFCRSAEESGCVLPRGGGGGGWRGRTLGSPPHLSVLICPRAGGCLSVVRPREWMPSSASGEMTSHLSLSCSVKSCSHPFWRPATAASSALVGLVSRREVGRPLHPRLRALLVVWGQAPGLGEGAWDSGTVL